ncbi:MAG: asparagine synthase (glutamine-hydrolyzing), partial [Flavobacteriales bacterium]|nr:asparagine synthase (glutamine-hydrolyzing) [Flavobacteriales bacterium]
IILHLYLKKGLSFVDDLNGAFAISILDEREGKLHLIRDRAGIKPLYWWNRDNQFVFASEIKSILKAGVEAELATEHLQRFFVFKYSPAQETLFKNIYKIAPGTILTKDIGSAEVQVKTYWKPSYKPETNYNYKEKQEEIRITLGKAVQRRLIADVPIANFLSGGLDSTIIAHHLRDHQEITHYCARKSEIDIKKEGTTSDFDFAKKLADEWGLSFEEIGIGSDKLTPEMVKKTIRYADDLIADGSQIPAYLIAESASKNAKVVLSGMGADELFMGYAGHQLGVLTRYLESAPLGQKTLEKRFAKIEAGKGRFKAFKRYLYKIGRYKEEGQMKYGLYSIVGDYYNSKSIFDSGSNAAEQFIGSHFPTGNDPFEQLHQFEFENFMVKNLSYTDRMSMANGLENRVPFLDHELMELAFTIQRKHKVSGKLMTKKILKDAYSDIIPGYVTKRRKAGFGMPLRSLLDQKEKIDKLMDGQFFGNFSGFNMEMIHKTINNHVSGAQDNSSIIYALISFEHWYKEYINK